MHRGSEPEPVAATSFDDRLALVRIWPVLPLVFGTYFTLVVLLPESLPATLSELVKVAALSGVVAAWWRRAFPRHGDAVLQVLGQHLRGTGWALAVLGAASTFCLTLAWLFLFRMWKLPLGLLPKVPASTWPGLGPSLVDALQAVLLMPILEEVLFRGLWFRKWRRRWGSTRAALASSLLFGIGHIDVVGSGIFGLVMALLYTRTGSLWAPIAAHCMSNALAQALRYYGWLASPGSDVSDQAAYAVALPLVALSAAWLVFFIRSSWRTLGRPIPLEPRATE